MIQATLILSLLFAAGSAFAAPKKSNSDKVEINSISCKIGPNRKEQYEPDTQIYVNLDRLVIENGKATVRSYSATILNVGTEDHGLVPDVKAGSFEGRDLVNSPYNGRKYQGHLKFDLVSQKAKDAGNFKPETADLIISPEYTVVKTIKQSNNWDKTWTWEIEVRKHSAVVAAHWDDHHGDYILLDCYSTASVNDSKGRN